MVWPHGMLSGQMSINTASLEMAEQRGSQSAVWTPKHPMRNLKGKNNTCMYFQEHGLSVLLARTGDAVCFACCAFASLVGCWETVTHLETLGSALSLEDPIWTSHFPMLNSLHQQWSEEKQSELIYVTIHRAALHKKEAHKCSTHFSTQLRNETLLVNSLTNTNK